MRIIRVVLLILTALLAVADARTLDCGRGAGGGAGNRDAALADLGGITVTGLQGMESTATGLSDFGFRWLDPGAGQWLGRDPIEEAGGLNLFGFCNNDAVNQVDLPGMDSGFIQDAATVAGAGAGLVGMAWGSLYTTADEAAAAAALFGPEAGAWARPAAGAAGAAALGLAQQYGLDELSNASARLKARELGFDEKCVGPAYSPPREYVKSALASVVGYGVGKTIVAPLVNCGGMKLAANSGGRIFYVGDGAETLARKIASETGYKTIYNTWYGKIGEKVTPYLSQPTSRKMWDFLSARFANGAKQGDDVISVFGRHRATGEHTLPIDSKSAWKRVEYPILDSKGIPYRPVLTE